MSSQLYVTGPVSYQVGVGSSNALLQLGFVESDPRISLRASNTDVFTDASGPGVPWDVLQNAEEAMIAADFVLYSETVMGQIKSRIRGGTPGAGAAGALGSLMRAEGNTFRLLMLFPYASKSSVYADMPACMNFPNAYLADAIDMTVGTKRRVTRVLFRCIPTWGYDGSWTLYNAISTGAVSVG